jgi:hypothetical protein
METVDIKIRDLTPSDYPAVRLKTSLTGLPVHVSTTYLPVTWRD